MFRERGGSSTFARHAFNELISFIAGWAILIDYLIVIALAAISVPHYLEPISGSLSEPGWEIGIAGLVIVAACALNIRGVTGRGRQRSLAALALADVGLQVAVIAVGVLAVWHPDRLTAQLDLFTHPSFKDVVGSVRAFSFVFLVLGLVILTATLCQRRRAARSGADGNRLRRGRRRAALGVVADGALNEPGRPTARARAAAAARPRRALALRRRLLGGRLLDLLRARRRRRPRPRPDAADLPRLGPALRPDHAQLRRGRRDAPRARRLLELRPPRLQRADRLHRRLGDPDRLPDRDRPGGDLGAPLPGADLRQLQQAGLGDRRRRPGDRRRLRAQHPQRHRARAAALARRCSPWPTSACSWR